MSLSSLPKLVRKYLDSESLAETTPSTVQRQTAEIQISGPALSEDRIPNKIHQIQYAVRGVLAIRSVQIAEELKNKTAVYPFEKILPCHIGNPMALPDSYTPLSYIRETVALCTVEKLIDRSDISVLFHHDNIIRARKYLAAIKSCGCYTESLGAPLFRHIIAKFLYERDQLATDKIQPATADKIQPFSPPNLDSIMMTDGASDAVETILSCLIGGPSDGILCPIPQYPLYSALIAKMEGTVVPYYLDEPNDWSLRLEDLVEAYDNAVSSGIEVKALVVISPGNPVPTFLSEDLISATLKFALARNILVIADEVYQANCYTKQFIPFRRILMKNNLGTQLASLHSSSKGLTGECGFRGGFAQLENVDEATLKILYKLRSIKLCSNVSGQIVMATILDPPTPDEDSYTLYMAEKTENLQNLRVKAKMVYEFFNSLPNITCQVSSHSLSLIDQQPIHGALYAFPKIEMPPKAIIAAEAMNMSVDLFYSLQLLDQTGIVTVNGDGFSQKPGTHHLRMTILPCVDDLKLGLERFKKFHLNFMINFL